MTAAEVEATRRIRTLSRVQTWVLRLGLALWVLGGVIDVLESNWLAALASSGAALVTITALSATAARTRLYLQLEAERSARWSR